MDSLVGRISPLLRLTRITTAFAAVGNVWFVILWSRGMPEEQAARPPIQTVQAWPPVALVAGALAALGLFAFAMALNDTLDLRRDRALHPHRPLPSGAVTLDIAVGLVATTLMLGIFGAALLGNAPVLVALLVGAAILAYNGAAKYVPSIGLVTLGLIYAGHMLIPNPRLVFLWPVWLAMTHALFVGAVTHRLAGRRPPLTRMTLVFAAAGWIFWSLVLAQIAILRGDGALWPEWVPLRAAIAPALLGVAFVLFALHKVRTARSGAKAAERVHRYGSLWLPLYATAWCFGANLVGAGLVLAGLTLVGLLGMTLLREVYSLIEQPVGYRR